MTAGVRFYKNNKQKRMDRKMKHASQLGSLVPWCRFMQLWLMVFLTVCVIEASYAGPNEEDVVVKVDGHGYLVKDMVSDVRIMLENQISYLAANPDKATPLDSWLNAMVTEKGIELAMRDREVIDQGLKPLAENAVLTFVNMRLLRKWANKANAVSSQGIPGGASPVGKIFLQELFGQGTFEQNLLLRTTVALSSNDLAIVEAAFRREILSRGTQLGAEMWATLTFMDKIGGSVSIEPKDFRSNAKDSLARFLMGKASQKHTVYTKNDSSKPMLKGQLVKIKAGVNRGVDSDGRDYENKLEMDIEMDATEITFADWKTVLKWAEGNGYDFTNVGEAAGDGYPVVNVSWYDCVKWCNARSEAEGLSPIYLVKGKVYRSEIQKPEIDSTANGYRLPTVSEWKYAARGGKVGLRFPWGNSISHAEANYVGMRDSAWPYDMEYGPHPKYGDVLGGASAPVASFKPNDYGLFDMVGNVWEMTQDVVGKVSFGEQASICGGGFRKRGGYFMRIERSDFFPCGDGRGDVGFRTLKVLSERGKNLAEKKEVSKSSDAVTKGDGAEIVVNQTLVELLSDTIREALRQPAFKMRNRAFSHATFPSWQKFEGGSAYSAGEYVCIWRKKPLLDIEADKSRWIANLGSGYEARAKGLAKSCLRYIHSLSIYKKGNFVGDVPVPSVVLMLEKSNHIRHLNICAFTPDGHRNFGDADFLSDDKAFLMTVFAAVSIAIGDTPSKIGDVDAGIKAMRTDLGTAMPKSDAKQLPIAGNNDMGKAVISGRHLWGLAKLPITSIPKLGLVVAYDNGSAIAKR